MYCKYGVIEIYAVQIYAICTWLIAGRIIVDVEIKLNFLLSKVKFGQHKKYQEWFQKKVSFFEALPLYSLHVHVIVHHF